MRLLATVLDYFQLQFYKDKVFLILAAVFLFSLDLELYCAEYLLYSFIVSYLLVCSIAFFCVFFVSMFCLSVGYFSQFPQSYSKHNMRYRLCYFYTENIEWWYFISSNAAVPRLAGRCPHRTERNPRLQFRASPLDAPAGPSGIPGCSSSPRR